MAKLCPACSKANPTTANYCYYDGRHLSQEGHEGPLQVGTLPLPIAVLLSRRAKLRQFQSTGPGLRCALGRSEGRCWPTAPGTRFSSRLADSIWRSPPSKPPKNPTSTSG